MNETPLDKFVAEKGQSEAARLLRVTAPAIHKALTAKRDICVLEMPDGSFQAQEKRPFPSQKSAA
ncbi:Cro/CI family transcriptional regulator [Pseudomonas azerbaijanoccidens]|uniref:Cro/CI family transcriptional regulator n=1 Tax=Pseudomonas azerbaijanoccidentalis TaxID=2842347 RepID=UPI00200B7D9F|nr:Cro/CI family transcriptional regulator [Pseudomonas azerbaijanoccidentalis]MCK8669385.1 Cro/CI family transcriptional regulator [Pseudomonas azerbaijanoccidentalis]